MKKALLILVLSAIISACSKNNEDRYSYTFSTGSALIIEATNGYMKYGKVVSGTNLVFEYQFERDDEENIADDEYAEFIRFEIDPSLNEFNYGDEELQTINPIFTQECFCGFYGEEKEVSPTGFISGKKVSDTKWDITIDVIFYGDESKNISNTFVLKE